MSETFYCGPFHCRSIKCTNGYLLLIRYKESGINKGIKLTFEDNARKFAKLYLEDLLKEWFNEVAAVKV